MKTLLIAAAAAAALAGAALPAAAQSFDRGYGPVQVRPIDQRFDQRVYRDRDGAWRAWREPEIERRIAERRRLEWLAYHDRASSRGWGWRDSGYGYAYGR